MAVHFNESSVAADPIGNNVKRQRLLTAARVKNTNILLDRLTLGHGGVTEISVPAENLAWFYMLEGESTLKYPGGKQGLTGVHTGFLPPRFNGTLASAGSAALLYVEVPNAARFDAGLAATTPQFRTVDWTREPVLKSEHDARKRIYVATPKLFGTKAIKAEMIFYPPGTSGSNHYHDGAEHCKYVLKGRGTGYTNESPHALRAGDLVYHPDLERHYSVTEGNEDMVFIEFFVPEACKTVWVDENRVCAWLPSGQDIQGGKPVREIKAHSSAELASPQDV
jgi:quercetin dioxygenase-like cupin family protein